MMPQKPAALSEQVINYIRIQAEQINQLEYGDITIIIQASKVVRGDIRTQWLAKTSDPKNGRIERDV